ncbi:MAG: PilZ domain-containing protein [Firmicutes bacterium]|nr:PilZ domain-containing protein [Bacillota bacterium]
MKQRYLILGPGQVPIARAQLLSEAGVEPMRFEVLENKAELVEAQKSICLLCMDDDALTMMGDVAYRRGDEVVVKPGKKLGAETRQNLRVPADFETVIYPVSTSWRGQRRIQSVDLSCGGIAFFCNEEMQKGEVIEVVLPIVQAMLIIHAEILRVRPEADGRFFYASKFMDLIEDEDAFLRQAVFSIQIGNK